MDTREYKILTHKFFMTCGLIALLSGCSVDNSLKGILTGSGNSISGSVEPLKAASAHAAAGTAPANKPIGASAKNVNATSSFTCTNPKANLFSLDASGARISAPLATVDVDLNGNYNFKNIRSTASTSYVVEVSGCSETLTRVITSNKNQNVTYGSTLVGWIAQGPNKSKLVTAGTAKIAELIERLSNPTSLADAYTKLNSDPLTASLFSQTFDIPINSLEDVAPTLSNVRVPLAFKEGIAQELYAELNHWSPNYEFAYIWKFGSEVIGTGENLNFAPSANTQGSRTIKLFYGQGTGGVLDQSKPFQSKSFDISIENILPATPPLLTLVSAAMTNSPIIQLSINTGAALGNCSSFSKLALTEENTLPPASMNEFSIECTQSGTQNVSFTLTSAPTGSKTLRLWARDSSGLVSTIFRSASVIYDTTAPVLSVTVPVTNSLVLASPTISGLCEGALQVAVSGTGASAPSTLACSSGTFSGSVTLSAGEGSKSLTLSQTDLSGNTGSINLTLIKDTVAPVINIATPAASSTTQGALTLTGVCETGTTLSFTGPISAVTNSICTAASYSQAVALTGTDGSKMITVTSTDTAGNSAVDTRTFIKDNSGPSVTIASPVAGTPFQMALTMSGACETGLSVTLSGDLQTNVTTSCGAGSYSNTVNLAAGETIKTITATQTDSAGNIGTVSKLVLRDNTPPSMTITSPSSGSQVQGSVTLVGTCETGLTVTISGAGVVGTTTSCSSSSFSKVIALTASEGSKAISISQTDQAGNSDSADTTLTKDSIAPALTITGPATNTVTLDSVTVVGACETGYSINIAGAITGSPLAATCSAGAYSQSLSLTGTDGTKTITFTQTDTAGNIATLNRDFIKDTTAPVLTIVTPVASAAFKSAFTLSGACETGLSISITGATPPTTTCTASAYSVSITTAAPEGAKTIGVTQTDSVGNSTSKDVAITFDQTPPVVNSFSISGSGTSLSNYVQVSLAATDVVTKVTHFCLRSNVSAQPPLNDGCWVSLLSTPPAVTPAASITVSNFYFLLGFSSGTYNLFGFVKDSAGNISSLSASGAGTAATDKASATYSPGAAPVLTDIVATNTDSPTYPPTSAQLTITSGNTVYIKWKANCANTCTTGSVKLYYTTNDTTFTQLPDASTTFNNGVNGSCTVDGTNSTGCYVWTNSSPTSAYFKIRVAVTDNASIAALSQSPAINLSNIRFLAGNTDSGIGGSALGGIISGNAVSVSGDSQSFVVASNGDIYVRDISKNIFRISPTDGLMKLFISSTGTSSGDGGPASAATLKSANKLILDNSDNLIIWDFDRIRRVNTSLIPMTIETIVGGGALTGDNVAPLQLAMDGRSVGPYDGYTKRAPFFYLPNGDLYFQSDKFGMNPGTGFRFRRILAANPNVVESIYPNGTGWYGNLSGDWSGTGNGQANIIQGLWMPFDLATGAVTNAYAGISVGVVGDNHTRFTDLNPSTFQGLGTAIPFATGDAYTCTPLVGRDGIMYYADRRAARIQKFDTVTRTWSNLVGTGVEGSCADGTAALSCPINLQEVYVTRNGQMYFWESGKIRIVNSAGNIQTIAGQGVDFGDGGSALSARFKNINSFGLWNDGTNDRLVIADKDTFKLREINLSTGVVSLVAGNGLNGNPTLGANATLQTLSPGMFIVLPLSGDIYYPRASIGIQKLTRSSKFWSLEMGLGGTNYSTADGLNGSDISSSWYTSEVLGSDGVRLLSGPSRYLTTPIDSMLKTYTMDTNFTQAHLLGHTGAMTGAEPIDGQSPTVAEATFDAQLGAGWDNFDSKWVIGFYNRGKIYKIANSGNVELLVDHAIAMQSFAYRRNSDLTTHTVYICDVYGTLRKKDLNTNAVTILTLPSSTYKCSGKNLIYSTSRNSLIFSYTQNGLSGMAEYLNP